MKPLSLILAILFIYSTANAACHYSCATCSGPAYTRCLSCSDANAVVQTGVTCDGTDEALLSPLGGFCGAPAYSRANPLGIVIIFVAIIAGIFLKSQYIMYFILSMQTLGLIALVQAAFPGGLSLILGSFEYFMLFSIMGQNIKPQKCKFMLKALYRLNDFLGTTSFRDNSLPILIIILIVTALLVLTTLFRAFRKESLAWLSDQVLEKVKLAFRTFLLLTMQQAILIIYAGIRFSSLSLNEGLILLMILYLIAFIYIVVDCNKNPLPFFRSSQLMNLTFIKRLMLPALVVIPYKFTYSLLIFLIGFNLIEILFLAKAKHSKTKNFIYLILELVCICLIGGFIVADFGNNSAGQANGLSIFATLILVVYIIIFAVEVVVGIKNRVKGGSVANNDEIWDPAAQRSDKSSAVREHDTIQDINNTQKIQQEGDEKIIHLSSGNDQKNPPNLIVPNQKKLRRFKVQ